MKKLLVIHQGALGDVVLGFPVWLGMKSQFDTIWLGCGQSLGALAVHLGIAQKCIPTESAEFATLFSINPSNRMVTTLNRFDTIILVSFSQVLEQTVSLVCQADVFRIDPKPPTSEAIHVTDYLFQQISSHGFSNLDTGQNGMNYKLLHQRLDSSQPPRILIHPGSGSLRKNWPLTSFIRVAKLLVQNGKIAEFIVGPADDHLMAPLSKSGFTIHRPDNLIELSQLIGSAQAVIGNDSGVCHLSGFMGIATLAIFGPSDPVRWAPRGRRIEILRPLDISCSPCFETQTQNCNDPVCLTRITPESVWDSIKTSVR